MLWLWGTEVSYEGHGLQWSTVEVRRLPVQHLNSHDSQGPDIHLSAVQLTTNHLRGHPIGRAHQGLAMVALASDTGTESEIRQFHLRVI